VDAAASWHHIDLCSQMGRSDNISSVIFSAGQPFVATSCGVWTTADRDLIRATWRVLPLPTGVSPAGTILAPSPNNNTQSLFACLGSGSRVYRSIDSGQTWDTGVDLGGRCTGLAAAPIPGEPVPSTSVAIHSTAAGNWEVTVVNHGSSTTQKLAFPGTGNCCGRTGVWVAPIATNPGGAKPGPGVTYAVFAADNFSFFVYRGGGSWSNGLPQHPDTWWMVFPPTYNSGAGFCPAYAANDGGVFTNGGNDCFFRDWRGANSGLHVTWGGVVSGLSYSDKPVVSNTDLLCQAANGGQPCTLLFLTSPDTDTFVREIVPDCRLSIFGTCLIPSLMYTWRNFNDGLGDSGEVLYDPAQPNLALACRNGAYHMFATKNGAPPGFDSPWFDITPTNAWQGAQDGGDQGIKVILTKSNETPATEGDYVAIMSTYRSNVNNCQSLSRCGVDIVVRNQRAANESTGKTAWSNISLAAQFGPGHVDGVYPSGGHANTTVYVRTSNDATVSYSLTNFHAGEVWKSQFPFAAWQLVMGSGTTRLNQAFNLFVNPEDPNELYATDLGSFGPTQFAIKVSRDGGQTWRAIPQLKDIATNFGEFDFDCGNFPHGRRTYRDKDILGNQCPLQQIVFVRGHPEIRIAVLYPGGLAFSRNKGLNWIALNATHALPAEQPIELPDTAFYDPWPNPNGNSSIFVALQGKGLKRLDGPFSTLEAGGIVYCPFCAGAPRPRGEVREVSALIDNLNTKVSLRRDPDGLYRGTILFDSAKVRELRFQFFVDDQSTPVYTHTLTDTERSSGVATLSNGK
jgi:hypothetical protein